MIRFAAAAVIPTARHAVVDRVVQEEDLADLRSMSASGSGRADDPLTKPPSRFEPHSRIGVDITLIARIAPRIGEKSYQHLSRRGSFLGVSSNFDQEAADRAAIMASRNIDGRPMMMPSYYTPRRRCRDGRTRAAP
jgi:hypothetical protein